MAVKQAELEKQTRQNLKANSRIEADYNKRPNGAGLNQFGYETFVGIHPVGMGTGTIREDYHLGVGDEIIINVSGQNPLVLDLTVDNEGRLVLPNLPPIQVAGRTFGEVRKELEARVSATSVGSKAVASVGTVRMISVMVMGEVSQPGMVSLTGLSTLVDALYASGGVTKMGSLRNITLQREGQAPAILDTYDLLMNRPTSPIPLLRDGDRVVVPTIGHTVAVTGEVKRPGIFELRYPDEGVTKNLLEWAGGPLRARGTKLQKQTLDKIGREIFEIIPQDATSHFGDSDILTVRMISNRAMDLVKLGGEVRVPGEYPLASANSVRELIGRDGNAENVIGLRAYLPFAVLQNYDRVTGIPSYRSFNLQEIIRGGKDIPLKDKDHVLVFSEDDIKFLSSNTLQTVLATQSFQDMAKKSEAAAEAPPKTPCKSLTELAGLLGSSQEGRLARAIQIAKVDRESSHSEADSCPKIYEENPYLLPFVLEHVSAILGEVRRPGNYPLIGKVSLQTLLSLSGGATREHNPARMEVHRNVPGANGKEELERIHVNLQKTTASSVSLQTGDIVQVYPKEVHAVTLSGHVRQIGRHDLASASSVSQLIGRGRVAEDVLLTGAYLPFAAIMSHNPVTGVPSFQAFNLQDVVQGIQDVPLRHHDQVVVFSENDIRFLSSTALQKVLVTRVYADVAKEEKAVEGRESFKLPRMASCKSLRELAELLGSASEGRFSRAVQSALTFEKENIDYAVTCPTIYEANSYLLPFVLEHIAAITGEVRRPGNYPLIDSVSLDTLVSLSGGFTNEHDPAQIEIDRDTTRAAGNTLTRFRVDLRKMAASDIPILQGDVVQIRPMETNREKLGITLVGEFSRPGYFDIRRDETLSSVIERAGGLTEQAYPMGAVFSREQMKKEETKQLARYVRDLQDAMMGVMQSGTRSQPGSEQGVVAAVNSLIAQTKETKPIGRIVIEADPTILSVHPELDTILMGGDVLYMPKRTNTVIIMGEVLSPGAFIFSPGLKPDDYIQKAGGLREFADQSRIFVVKPDGTAQPLRLSAWNYSTTNVPPGSTIVIPREVKMPVDLLGLTQALSSVVSSLAISAASIATIQR
ncbi:MAG: hypothetical protein G8345_01770 [Magnetococcales bacterium]|nr:SLBB domain-containing protein [Magnetococcales bacterium]NGZ25598.1 hypothetical protein [Magnetococcales bacterium]